ncbi:uncharacterized protein LOC135365874 isoform X1 [Ornithodoros turicata]|uniref:uncharacterized protein LOC135365874 isoform X1 n=1 Tax=Ornithodoros turicata TaxID=34597 RepID=UPI0031392182
MDMMEATDIEEKRNPRRKKNRDLSRKRSRSPISKTSVEEPSTNPPKVSRERASNSRQPQQTKKEIGKKSDEEKSDLGSSIDATRTSRKSLSWKYTVSMQTLSAKSCVYNDSERESPKSTNTVLRTVVSVVLILGVTAAGAFWIYKHYKDALRQRKMIECRTAECKLIQRQLNNELDKKIHPCDDFYSYVCSKWIKRESGGFLHDVINIYTHSLITALTSPESSHPDRFGLHVMAKLYQACRDYAISSKGTFKDAVGQVIELLNFRTILKRQQHIFVFLLETSLTKNIHSTFTVRFHRSEKSKYLRFDLGYSIRSKMYGVVDADTSSASEIDESMTLMTTQFLNDSRISSNIDAATILSLDAKIHKLLSAKAWVTQLTFNSIAHMTSRKTIKQAIEVVNQNAPPGFRVDFRSQVEIAGLGSLLDIRRILSNGSEGLREMYHLVNIATDLLRFTAHRNIARIPFVCLRATRIALTNTWQFVVARSTAHLSSGTVARELGARVRDMVTAGPALRLFNEDERQKGQEILQRTTAITYDGSEVEMLDEHTDYASWKLEGKDLFAVYVEAGQKEKVMLRKSFSFTSIIRASDSQLKNDLRFHEAERLLTIPTAYQNPPVLFFAQSDEIPLYINVATLGVEIAKEMVRALTVPFRSSSTSINTLHGSLTCLKKVGAAHGINMTRITGANLWEADSVLWYYALRSVYEGLQHLVINVGESTSGDIWKETQHYLFIRFCMLSCMPREEDSKEIPEVFKERCLVPLLSIPDFAAAFGCTERENFRSDTCVSQQK